MSRVGKVIISAYPFSGISKIFDEDQSGVRIQPFLLLSE